ncbi:ribulose-5-phosphate 4-epimerase/fuculose-1-phosphate aldolase [Bradyrhizobium sp. USDA 4509]
MILKHHGLLTVGRTIGEAFINMYYMEQSCRIQVAATQCGEKLTLPSGDVTAHRAVQFKRNGAFTSQRPWAALKRRLDRISPDYVT